MKAKGFLEILGLVEPLRPLGHLWTLEPRPWQAFKTFDFLTEQLLLVSFKIYHNSITKTFFELLKIHYTDRQLWKMAGHNYFSLAAVLTNIFPFHLRHCPIKIAISRSGAMICVLLKSQEIHACLLNRSKNISQNNSNWSRFDHLIIWIMKHRCQNSNSANEMKSLFWP